MRFTFPRRARLTRQAEFEAVYRDGLRLSAHPLRVRALRREAACADSRLGISLSKEVSPVALRNKWKRAIREAFRLQRHLLPASYDLVVSVEWGARREDVCRVAEALRSVVEQLREPPHLTK